MEIIITSSGRSANQVTLPQIADDWEPKLAVYEREKMAYSYANPNTELLVVPDRVSNLSEKRQWIVNQCKDQFLCLLDDDLRFFNRRIDDPTKFEHANLFDVGCMLSAIAYSLHDYTHVGVCAREGGNRKTDTSYVNERIMRVLAYDVHVLRNLSVRFDRLPCMSDFDANLQLLRAGRENILLCNWVHDQGSSNAPGGCSRYRTKEMLAETAYKLAELHAPFVKAVERETKGAWGGGSRVDVRIQWKKAYAESLT